MTINNTDTFLVERSGTSYKLQAQNLMATLQDTDLMLVERSGTSYKATGLDIKNSLGSDQPTLKATASGAITDGETVVLNSDGTVSGITSTSYTQSASNATDITGYNNKEPHPIVYDPTNNRVITVRDHSHMITAKVGTFNGSTITWQSNWQSLYTAGSGRSIHDKNRTQAYWDTTSNQLIVVFSEYANYNGYVTVIARGFNSSNTATGNAVNQQSYGQSWPNPPQETRPSIVQATVDSSLFQIFTHKSNGSNQYRIHCYTYTIGSNSITFENNQEITSYNSSISSFTAAINPSGTGLMSFNYSGNFYHRAWTTNTAQDGITKLGSSDQSFHLSTGNTTGLDRMTLNWDSNLGGFWVTARYAEGSYNWGRNLWGGFIGVTGGVPSLNGTPIRINASVGPDYFTYFHTPSRMLIIGGGYDSSGEQNMVLGFQTLFKNSSGVITAGTKFKPNLVSNYPIGARISDGMVYVSSLDKFLIPHINAYWEGLTYYQRDVTLYNPTYTSTNLTSTNYLGIADGAASNNAEAKVIVYPGVADGQSGLTTGTKYYVQMDGSLGTSAAAISQVAGVAQSATTIKVQYS